MKSIASKGNNITEKEITRCISFYRVIDWIRQKNLLCLPSNLKFKCGSDFIDQIDSHSIEQRNLLCRNKICGNKSTIRMESIFFGLKSPLTFIYEIIFNPFVKNESIENASIKYDVSLSTLIKYNQCLQLLLKENYI